MNILKKEQIIDKHVKTIKDVFLLFRKKYIESYSQDTVINHEDRIACSRLLIIIEEYYVKILKEEKITLSFFKECKSLYHLMNRCIYENEMVLIEDEKKQLLEAEANHNIAKRMIAPQKVMDRIGEINKNNYIICFSEAYNSMVDNYNYSEKSSRKLNTFLNDISSRFNRVSYLDVVFHEKSRELTSSIIDLSKTLALASLCKNVEEITDHVVIDYSLIDLFYFNFNDSDRSFTEYGGHKTQMGRYLHLLKGYLSDNAFGLKIIITEKEIEMVKAIRQNHERDGTTYYDEKFNALNNKKMMLVNKVHHEIKQFKNTRLKERELAA